MCSRPPSGAARRRGSAHQILARLGDDLAAIVLEPVPANYGLLAQRPDWLHFVEERCRKAGALLVFDEVITGFRTDLAGAAGHYAIEPDLVCYGKVIGGGFPVGAYAGRADLMTLVAPEGPVYQAGTLSANPIGMRAGLASLERMEQDDGWRTLEDRSATFTGELEERLRAVDPVIRVVRHASIFWIAWSEGGTDSATGSDSGRSRPCGLRGSSTSPAARCLPAAVRVRGVLSFDGARRGHADCRG
jgi:glutamate-1-semialdehyde aminotransferase